MERIMISRPWGGSGASLDPLSDGRFVLKGSFLFLRVVSDAETKTIRSVDLEGGPTINVGDVLRNGRTVISLELEENELFVTLGQFDH